MLIIALITLLITSIGSAHGQEYIAPTQLSQAGVFSSINRQIPAPGVVPYEVNSPLWSDGAAKTRFIRLPPGKQIEFSPDRDWAFPSGTLLIKNFYLDFIQGDPSTRRIIETRFLVKRDSDEGWDGYSYQWNTEGTDAKLLTDSTTVTYVVDDPQDPVGFFLQEYYFPSADDCRECHTKSAGFALGPNTAQLNRVEKDGRNQLARLSDLFSNPSNGDFSALPRLVDPNDPTASLAARARSYLHANCAQCHRPQSVSRTAIDLRFDTALEQMRIVDAFPTLGDLGAQAPRIVAAGEPERSTLYLRMLTLGSFRMPALATSRVDQQGSQLVADWITSLAQPTAVLGSNLTQPLATALGENFPNPFNPNTTIEYQVEAFNPVELNIYDALGQKVRTLVASSQQPGYYRVQWDGRTDAGATAASGVYIYQLKAGAHVETRRLTLLK